MVVAVTEPGYQGSAGGVNDRGIRSDEGIKHLLVWLRFGRLICGAEIGNASPLSRDHPTILELTRLSDKDLPTLDYEVCRFLTQSHWNQRLSGLPLIAELEYTRFHGGLLASKER
jgi:hypothetical protein